MADEIFENNDAKIKLAIISGANEALKRKGKDWKKSDNDILQEITDNIDEIISKID